MHALIRKSFWTFDLACLAAAAWLVAGTIQVLRTQRFAAFPALRPGGTVTRPVASVPVPDNQVVVQRNLFASALAGPLLPKPQPPVALEEVPSELRIALVGTVVANDPHWSLALVTELDEAATGVVRLGDALAPEAVVTGIFPRWITLMRNGRLEFIELQERDPGAVLRATRPASASPDGSAAGGPEGIQRIADGQYRVDRRQLERWLLNPNRLGARVVPVASGNRALGFKVFGFRPNSIPAALGLQNNDVITKVSGFQATGIEKILEIIQKLKGAREVELEVSRGGQARVIRYQID